MLLSFPPNGTTHYCYSYLYSSNFMGILFQQQQQQQLRQQTLQQQ